MLVISGTTQLSPSFGKQSNTFSEMVYIQHHVPIIMLQFLLSALSISPKAPTKCPLGYLELIGQESTTQQQFVVLNIL